MTKIYDNEHCDTKYFIIIEVGSWLFFLYQHLQFGQALRLMLLPVSFLFIVAGDVSYDLVNFINLGLSSDSINNTYYKHTINVLLQGLVTFLAVVHSLIRIQRFYAIKYFATYTTPIFLRSRTFRI
jgi:hypothetical protein